MLGTTHAGRGRRHRALPFHRQSLSEVRLALRTKASMLVPGETVNMSGGASELLVSSPRWGRAFLGAVESQSALQPRLLDQKVSGVVLVDWAAWAASMTFSFTGLGYERREVDAFRSASTGGKRGSKRQQPRLRPRCWRKNHTQYRRSQPAPAEASRGPYRPNPARTAPATPARPPRQIQPSPQRR
jgi:hypothetical protein